MHSVVTSTDYTATQAYKRSRPTQKFSRPKQKKPEASMTTRLVQNVVQRTTEGFQQMSLGQSDDLLPESFTVLTQDGISLAKVSVIDVSQTYLL